MGAGSDLCDSESERQKWVEAKQIASQRPYTPTHCLLPQRVSRSLIPDSPIHSSAAHLSDDDSSLHSCVACDGLHRHPESEKADFQDRGKGRRGAELRFE
jgi:hypothetical protein